MGLAIGIDIGATTIKAGLVNDGKILFKSETKTPRKKALFIATLKEIIKSIFDYAKNNLNRQPKFIGVASPGPSNYKTGVININNANIKNLDIKKILKPYCKKIIVSNDADAFTLYHSMLGLGSEYKTVSGITLGTGIGGALIIDRTIYTGRNNASEIGHMSYRDSTYEEEFQKIIKKTAKTELGVDNAFDLYLKAKENNPYAINIFKHLGILLGNLIVDITYAYDPEIIVIGGKIANSWKFIKKSSISTAKNRCIVPLPKISRNNITYAGILGAALLNK